MSKQISVTFRNEYKAQQNYMPSYPLSRKNVAVDLGSDTLPIYGKATNSSVTNPLNTPAGYNIKNVIAELEKRRAEFFALACAAETRAQEAEKKIEEVQNKLEEETSQLLVAEKMLREIEVDRQRQLQAVEIERMKTIEATKSHGEAEARLKKTERRIKEAEKDVTSLTLALAKAYQKKAEAEASARTAEEKAHITQELLLRSEASTHAAVEGNLIFGLLIFASKSKLLAIEKALHDVESKHQPRENYLKNLLQKQTANLRSIPEKAPLAEGEFRSLNLLNPADYDQACRETEQKGLGIKLKPFIYGVVSALLLAACLGLITAFFQN